MPATAGRQSVVAIDRNGTTDPIEIASFFMNQSELWCTMPRFSNTDIQKFQSRLSLCVIELSIHGGLPQFVALTRVYLNKTIPLSDGTTEIRLPQTHAISELYLASGTLFARTHREKRFDFGRAFDRPTTSWDLPAVAREYDLLTASVNVRLAADAIQVSLDLEASTKASNAKRELTELNIDIYRIVDSHGTPIRVMLVKAPTRR